MRRSVTPLLAALALAAVTLTGCDDAGPEGQAAIGVAHAAPGLLSYDVTIDGRGAGTLSAGTLLADTVDPGQHTIAVSAGSGSLEAMDEVEDGEALAVVLMNAEDPTLGVYRNTHFGGMSRLLVINAVPGTDLDYVIEGNLSRIMSSGQAFQDEQNWNLGPGTYEARVWPTGTTDTVDVGEVTLPVGRSFVVFYPDPTGPEPYAMLAF